MSSTSTTAEAARSRGLFRNTPLIRSIPLSQRTKKDVWLKLDALQASGSFKDRGVSHYCQTLIETQGINQLVSSSGGNAGLATASVGQLLQLPVTVVVPTTTKQVVIDKLQTSMDAHVIVMGDNWNQADTYTRQYIADLEKETTQDGQPKKAAYVNPFDHPLLWTGHSTLVDEICQDLSSSPTSSKIGALVVSVGGGGLLCGALEGLERNQQYDTRVVAAETKGAGSFALAWNDYQNKDKDKEPSFDDYVVPSLEGIQSVATSLGALQVTAATLQRSVAHTKASRSGKGRVISTTCTDPQAVSACLQFAADHRLLVEPACGAALAVLYDEHLFAESGLADVMTQEDGPIVVEICGGSAVNPDLLQQWKQQFGL